MHLTKSQVSALAMSFCRERNAGFEAEVKRRSRDARDEWDKTREGKEYAKAPAWMKATISEYRVNDRVEMVWKGRPLPKKVDLTDVERAIVLATINAQSLDDIKKFLSKQFVK